MSTHRETKKKVLLAVSSFATAVAVLLPATAHADPTTILDLDTVLKTQSPFVNSGTCPKILTSATVKAVDSAKVTSSNTTATPTGQPTTTLGDTWYVGSSTLYNNTPRDQTLSTTAFSRSITQTVSTAVTAGISLARTVTAKATIGNTGMEASTTLTVSFSATDTQMTSDMVTYTAPPQAIVVPPRTAAEITVYLQEVSASGKLALRTQLGGTFRTKYSGKFASLNSSAECWTSNIPLYDSLAAVQTLRSLPWSMGNLIPRLPSSLSLNPVTKTLDFNGEGTYTATYGSTYKVFVNYVPMDSGSQQEAAPTPYTLSVPAQPAA